MYRINYCHPISGNQCSRTFKTLFAAYKHIRNYVSEMTFEVIPIGVGECYYVHYTPGIDYFLTISGDEQIVQYLEDIKNDK